MLLALIVILVLLALFGGIAFHPALFALLVVALVLYLVVGRPRRGPPAV